MRRAWWLVAPALVAGAVAAARADDAATPATGTPSAAWPDGGQAVLAQCDGAKERTACLARLLDGLTVRLDEATAARITALGGDPGGAKDGDAAEPEPVTKLRRGQGGWLAFVEADCAFAASLPGAAEGTDLACRAVRTAQRLRDFEPGFAPDARLTDPAYASAAWRIEREDGPPLKASASTGRRDAVFGFQCLVDAKSGKAGAQIVLRSPRITGDADAVKLTLKVDGKPVADRSARLVAADNAALVGFQTFAEVERVTGALIGGSGATVSLEGLGSLRFGLRGSGDALKAAIAACGFAGP